MKSRFLIKNLTFFLIPLLIPLFILGSFSIYITQNFILNDINKNNEKMLLQEKDSIELMLKELDLLSINISMNPTTSIKLQSILSNLDVDQSTLDIYNILRSYTDAPVNSKPYIHSIYVYFENENGNFLASGEGIVNLESYYNTGWYQSYLHSGDDTRFWIEANSVRQYSFEKEDTQLVTAYKKIYSSGSHKDDGILVMNFKRSSIDDILNGSVSYSGQNAFILDRGSNIIAGNTSWLKDNNIDIGAVNRTPESFFEFKSGKNAYVVSAIDYNNYNLKYLSITPKYSLYQFPTQLGNLTGILLFISFVLGLVLSYFFTRRSYHNISDIVSIFESAEKGLPLPPLPSRVKNEYGFILQNIIKTFVEQSYLKVQLSEKKYRLKTIEMIALQAQINPHFLFNTLKTMFWKSLALTGGQNEVSQMVEHLSGILHYSLDSAGRTVTLEEEIKSTQSYIEIQKVRYRDKFRVIWQYDDAIAQYKVIKLLLQPFIENCIYHAIKEDESVLHIKIKLLPILSHIKIAVIDNGTGIDRASLSRIREKLLEEGDYSDHIGLYNTNKRLKLSYGEKYGITLRSRKGLGTVVYISIPVENIEASSS